MLRKVLRTIKQNNMLKAGDRVVIALSGGADSMALLCVLYELKAELGLELYAAHMNHSIREEAYDDYLFAERFCDELGVELFYKEVDIPYIAKSEKLSEEEAGRRERYKFFNEVSESVGGALIATGHHMSDCAETVLFNLFRGSGLRGLGGIAYVRGNIIRPLSDVNKDEIEEYLTKKGVTWREDRTNNECIYARNNIRLVIMKEIEKAFPGAVKKINETARSLRIDDEFILSEAKKSSAFCNGYIDCEKFNTLHESVKVRVAMMALEEWGAEVDKKKIKAIFSICIGGSGKLSDLGNAVKIENSYGRVFVAEENDKNEEIIFIKTGEAIETEVFGGRWTIKTVDKSEKIRDNKMMILLDWDKIPGDVCIRCRRDGDFIAPQGMHGTKKLKKVFIDLKIPTRTRDKISMLALDNEILFIPGIRKTRNYTVDENTKIILAAEYKGKEDEDGREG